MQAEIKNFANFYGHASCFYPFVLDTYQGVCPVRCRYCYSQQSKFGSGSFLPLQVDNIKKEFKQAFEGDGKGKYSSLLQAKVPLRIGGFVECFSEVEKQYQVSLQLLKLLQQYDYPAMIITKSSLLLEKQYLQLLDPARIAVEVSLPFVDETVLQKIEPLAATKQQRLELLAKLQQQGFFTTARINPLFPLFHDGYFLEQQQKYLEDQSPFSLELFAEIARTGTTNIVAGFVHLNNQQLSEMSILLGFDLAQWMTVENRQAQKGFIYRTEELLLYYKYLKEQAKIEGLSFSPCYLGQSENMFSQLQSLFCDKNDCCNLKCNIKTFARDNAVNYSTDNLITRLAKFIIKHARDN